MRQPLASVSFSQSFQNLLDTVMHSLPKILVFLVVLVVGWIIAKVVQKAIVMILHRVHFDNFAERGAVGKRHSVWRRWSISANRGRQCGIGARRDGARRAIGANRERERHALEC